LVSEVQTDILENEHNSDSALEKACNTSDANKVAQYKKTMEQQITELNLQLVEMSTSFLVVQHYSVSYLSPASNYRLF
jgi:hypothetical protein